jgi:hypothetical protein
MWSVKNVNQINLQSNNNLNNVTKANPWLAFIVYYNLRLTILLHTSIIEA